MEALGRSTSSRHSAKPTLNKPKTSSNTISDPGSKTPAVSTPIPSQNDQTSTKASSSQPILTNSLNNQIPNNIINNENNLNIINNNNNNTPLVNNMVIINSFVLKNLLFYQNYKIYKKANIKKLEFF